MSSSFPQLGNEDLLLSREKPSPKRFPLRLVTTQGQLQIHQSKYRGSFSSVFSDAIWTAGLGSSVLIASFLKGGVSQGPKKITKLCEKALWLRPDMNECITSEINFLENVDKKKVTKSIREVWEFCKEKLFSEKIDRLVLDEIGIAISMGFIDHSEFITTIENRPSACDVILTGPSIPSDVQEMADQITVLR